MRLVIGRVYAVSGALSEADDGTRTHDLLHGKRVRASWLNHPDLRSRVAPSSPSGTVGLRGPVSVMASHHSLTKRTIAIETLKGVLRRTR